MDATDANGSAAQNNAIANGSARNGGVPSYADWWTRADAVAAARVAAEKDFDCDEYELEQAMRSLAPADAASPWWEVIELAATFGAAGGGIAAVLMQEAAAPESGGARGDHPRGVILGKPHGRQLWAHRYHGHPLQQFQALATAPEFGVGLQAARRPSDSQDSHTPQLEEGPPPLNCLPLVGMYSEAVTRVFFLLEPQPDDAATPQHVRHKVFEKQAKDAE